MHATNMVITHKASECKEQSDEWFHEYEKCQEYSIFQWIPLYMHQVWSKETNYRSNVMSGNVPQKGITCYNYNKQGCVTHICRGKNVTTSASQKKVDLIKKEMKKMWVKKKKIRKMTR